MFTAEEYMRYSLVWQRQEEDKKKLLEEILELAKGDTQAQTVGKEGEKAKGKKKENKKQIHGPVSTLSLVEQSEYMYLLQCYQKRIVVNPSLEEQQDIIRLAELQSRVVLEQQEFLRMWPQVPGRRPETFAKGCDSWVQERLTELKRKWPKGPWVPIKGVEKVSLLKAASLSPCFLKHVARKAGTVRQPEPGCALLELLPSHVKFPVADSSTSQGTPVTAAPLTPKKIRVEGMTEGKVKNEHAEDVLAHADDAVLLVDLETLLVDWQGSAWILPFTIADSSLICLGTVLPSGTVRDWNERLYSYLLHKWIEAHQSTVFSPKAGAKEDSANQLMEETAQQLVKTYVEHPAQCPSKRLNVLEEGEPSEPMQHPVEEMAEQPSQDMEFNLQSEDVGISSSSSGSVHDLVIDEGLELPSVAPTPMADVSDSAALDNAAGLPCPDGDVWYDLWELTPNGKRVLLRHQAWTDSDGQLCTMMVKPEYQSSLGAEALSALEETHQMARLSLFPRLLRVRVDVQSGHVLLVEEVKSELDDKNPSLNALFGPINALADQLHGLGPGMYLLTHKAGEAHAQILVPGTGDGWDLHAELERRAPHRPSVSSAMGKVHDAPVPPLDPEVIFPDHFQQGHVPLTFPPGQFEAVAQCATSEDLPSFSGAGPSKKVSPPATGTTTTLKSGSVVLHTKIHDFIVLQEVEENMAGDVVENVVENVVEDVVEDVVENVVEDVVENVVEDVVENVVEDLVKDRVEDMVEGEVKDVVGDSQMASHLQAAHSDQ